MRNWHQLIVRLDQARQLLQSSNNSEEIIIGLSERQLKFSVLFTDEGTYYLNENNYDALHTSLDQTSPSQKKIIFRDKNAVENSYVNTPSLLFQCRRLLMKHKTQLSDA